MDKQVIVEKILDDLAQELELLRRAARASHAEATHEQNKAENKYDTRGLEAAYLARGQSRQIAVIEQAIQEYQTLALPRFGAADPIDIGALVHVMLDTERLLYFVGPSAGGHEVQNDNKEITVLTPQSPLGGQLLGKKKGASGQMDLGGSARTFKILEVE